VAWAEFHIGAAQASLHQNQFAGIVAFDRVTDELQNVPDHKCDQRPRSWVLLVPDQKVDRQDERHRQTNQMKELIARMQMALTVIFPEAAHVVACPLTEFQVSRRDRNGESFGLEFAEASRDNAAWVR
jgi:hypothetical protein